LSYVGLNFGYLLLTSVPIVLGTILTFAWRDSPASALLGVGLIVGACLWYMRAAPLVGVTPKVVRFMRWCYAIGWSALGGFVFFLFLRSVAYVP
jgi:hypothetical protein